MMMKGKIEDCCSLLDVPSRFIPNSRPTSIRLRLCLLSTWQTNNVVSVQAWHHRVFRLLHNAWIHIADHRVGSQSKCFDADETACVQWVVSTANIHACKLGVVQGVR
eukprot:TRINITY_DN2379_c1_g5_i1.p1 TRINITY_DN2379_c1_g5~~TRINITY_DN2379_c1_g5_i1.p1  ORF type:complete len:107 (-),score=0.69 TRINITY_DN2379_c1_g5_i1:129-449(-)